MATINTKKPQTSSKANPPVAKIRIGLLTATIWARATDSGTLYNITFERRYRDAKGEWHSSHSYDTSDLLTLGKLADQAHSRIIEIKVAEAAA